MPYYELTPAIDPGTGDLSLDTTTLELSMGAPIAEIVAFVVRTEQGTYAPDPTLGVKVPNKAKANAVGELDASIRAALAFLTKPRLLTNLQITAEVRGNALLFEVSFVDPRVGAKPVKLSGRF